MSFDVAKTFDTKFRSSMSFKMRFLGCNFFYGSKLELLQASLLSALSAGCCILQKDGKNRKTCIWLIFSSLAPQMPFLHVHRPHRHNFRMIFQFFTNFWNSFIAILQPILTISYCQHGLWTPPFLDFAHRAHIKESAFEIYIMLMGCGGSARGPLKALCRYVSNGSL